MRFDAKTPPRRFAVGTGNKLTISDCGSMALDPDEQVTLTTPSGGEYDITRKDWGFYATPSLNGRLIGFGLRGALTRNTQSGRIFVMLVERGFEDAFHAYLAEEAMEVVCWLDGSEPLGGK
ncbi:hypothetical protein A6A04_15800 [Paramagnetospirillum marisnigri]|uniref:Uncharacterized protein n=1 Tax=Paramagnetospirillum marisnigri TaxID=1285242 RepID=A0A178MSY2_9PROT|nr:hypothetical protein [Paramagnetospirillum marisnigri]OAN52760.1 hypothetical protein A6A04_15800 [Paramagnetospirillum marisnigri]